MGYLIKIDQHGRLLQRIPIRGPTRVERVFDEKMPVKIPPQFQLTFRYNPLALPKGEKVIFRRRIKGIGDMVSLLSAVRTLKRLRPDLITVMWTKQPLDEIARVCPDIDEVITSDDYEPDGLLINCDDPCPCGVYESNVKEINLSRPQIFCLAAGLPWQGLKPRLKPDYSTLQYHPITLRLKPKPRPWIGVILRSAERWKDWPYTRSFIRKLLKRHYTVIAIDKRVWCRAKGIINAKGLTVSQLIALIASLDLLITPDTGPLHIAEALDIPTIALFGSMDSEVRRRTYSQTSVRYIQGKCPLDRKPCWYSTCQPKWSYQPCMRNIKVPEILSLVREVLHET